MPMHDLVAAQDVPHYGSFSVEAETQDAALGAATARLLAGAADFDDADWEGAHSLRIVTLQGDDQDLKIVDVSLDPEAPLWPGRDFSAALRRSTGQLAFLLSSLGEEAEYLPELEQMTANLRLLGDSEAMKLVEYRATAKADRWVEAVLCWALAPDRADAVGE